MRFYSLLLLITGSCWLATAATAQRRAIRDLTLLPEAQVELALKGNDYILAGFSLITNPNSSEGGTFAAGQLRLGYEHFWSEKWSGGATLRILGGGNNESGDFLGLSGNVTPGLLVRHTGKIGSLNFSQRLGLEYATQISSSLNNDNTDRAYARLRFDLDRVFPLSEKLALRPRIAYELATYLRLQRDEQELKERVVDFGNLRAELGVRLSPRVDFTPWVASQTRYFRGLPSLDMNGVIIRSGKANFITPLVGLDVRLTLPTKSANIDREALPTQH